MREHPRPLTTKDDGGPNMADESVAPRPRDPDTEIGFQALHLSVDKGKTAVEVADDVLCLFGAGMDALEECDMTRAGAPAWAAMYTLRVAHAGLKRLYEQVHALEAGLPSTGPT